jgi:hypothetical protein
MVRGSQESRPRTGQVPDPPDVVEAQIVHSLNQRQLTGVRVEVDSALNVRLSGTVSDRKQLASAIEAATQVRPRTLSYEFNVVGHDRQ